MNKTYSEQAQAIYFKAARDLYKVAAQVYDDCQNQAEFINPHTVEWAKNTARRYADMAREQERLGHELCWTPPVYETGLRKARQMFGDAVSRFQAREQFWADTPPEPCGYCRRCAIHDDPAGCEVVEQWERDHPEQSARLRAEIAAGNGVTG